MAVSVSVSPWQTRDARADHARTALNAGGCWAGERRVLRQEPAVI